MQITKLLNPGFRDLVITACNRWTSLTELGITPEERSQLETMASSEKLPTNRGELLEAGWFGVGACVGTCNGPKAIEQMLAVLIAAWADGQATQIEECLIDPEMRNLFGQVEQVAELQAQLQAVKLDLEHANITANTALAALAAKEQALSTQGDDAARLVQDLQNKIHQLEKTNQELEKSMATVTSVAAGKTMMVIAPEAVHSSLENFTLIHNWLQDQMNRSATKTAWALPTKIMKEGLALLSGTPLDEVEETTAAQANK